jgi:hypothetical protein
VKKSQGFVLYDSIYTVFWKRENYKGGKKINNI